MAGRRIGLARARRAAAYSKETLAYAMKVDLSTVGRWEAGDTDAEWVVNESSYSDAVV